MSYLRRQLGGGIILALTLLLAFSPSWAQEERQSDNPAKLVPTPLLLQELRPDLDGFFYRQTARPDPFRPFLSLLPDERDKEKLVGLQRFEPNQLILTAIVRGNRTPLALVEDPEGVGHFVRPGAVIGRNGRVEQITTNRVIIRQQLTLMTGEKEYHTVEMVLKHEEEER